MKPKKNECWCGRPVHYEDSKTRQRVEEIIDRFGEYVTVKLDGNKNFKVQRHYIALHGINNKDLAELGFEEVVSAGTPLL